MSLFIHVNEPGKGLISLQAVADLPAQKGDHVVTCFLFRPSPHWHCVSVAGVLQATSPVSSGVLQHPTSSTVQVRGQS